MPSDKHPGGAPTKYRPEYCADLIIHMSKGLSYQSFAGHVRVNIDTLYEWETNNPEFSDAKKKAMEINRLFWETAGIEGMYQPSGPGSTPLNPTIYIFNMKNRFPKEWRDRQEIESTVTQTTEHKVSEDLKPLIELFTKVLNDK